MDLDEIIKGKKKKKKLPESTLGNVGRCEEEG